MNQMIISVKISYTITRLDHIPEASLTSRYHWLSCSTSQIKIDCHYLITHQIDIYKNIKVFQSLQQIKYLITNFKKYLSKNWLTDVNEFKLKSE